MHCTRFFLHARVSRSRRLSFSQTSETRCPLFFPRLVVHTFVAPPPPGHSALAKNLFGPRPFFLRRAYNLVDSFSHESKSRSLFFSAASSCSCFFFYALCTDCSCCFLSRAQHRSSSFHAPAILLAFSLQLVHTFLPPRLSSTDEKGDRLEAHPFIFRVRTTALACSFFIHHAATRATPLRVTTILKDRCLPRGNIHVCGVVVGVSTPPRHGCRFFAPDAGHD